MKKIILPALIAAAAISTSCRKERTCDCRNTQTTVTTGFGAGTKTQTSSYKTTMSKQKKNEFILTTDCFSTKETHTDSGGNGPGAYTEVITNETTCDLK